MPNHKEAMVLYKQFAKHLDGIDIAIGLEAIHYMNCSILETCPTHAGRMKVLHHMSKLLQELALVYSWDTEESDDQKVKYQRLLAALVPPKEKLH